MEKSLQWRNYLAFFFQEMFKWRSKEKKKVNIQEIDTEVNISLFFFVFFYNFISFTGSEFIL